MRNVINVILSHQSPAEVDRLILYWKSVVTDANVVIAYGGSRESFERIQSNPKIFIDDAGLRTRDHQREGQSYTALFKEVSRWLQTDSKQADFVTLYEFDHLPLVKDLNARQFKLMQIEQADVLAYHLGRIDGTSHPHYLYYGATSEFTNFFSHLSVRSDRATVLSMCGTGSFWKREAFDAIASSEEPAPIYFEIYLPTLAHHLGFRVRDYGQQNAFVSHQGDFSAGINAARAKGAWTLHPVKNLPQNSLPRRKS